MPAAVGAFIGNAVLGTTIGAAVGSTFAGTIIASAIGAGVMTAATGGSFLKGALSGALGGALGGAGPIGNFIGETVGATAAPFVTGGLSGALTSAVNGDDVLQGALFGAAMGGVGNYLSSGSGAPAEGGGADFAGAVQSGQMADASVAPDSWAFGAGEAAAPAGPATFGSAVSAAAPANTWGNALAMDPSVPMPGSSSFGSPMAMSAQAAAPTPTFGMPAAPQYSAAGDVTNFPQGQPASIWDNVKAGAGEMLSAKSLVPSLVSSGANYLMANKQAEAMKQMQAASDPYGPYRAENAAELQAFMDDPSKVTSLPGYQQARKEGEQAIMRKAAAGGMIDSPASSKMMYDFNAGLFDEWYRNHLNYLAGLSGATTSPAASANAQAAMLQSKNNYLMNAIGQPFYAFGTTA